MKKISIIFITILLSISMAFFIYKKCNVFDIEYSNQSWLTYDNNMEIIKMNIKSIKDFNIEDKDYNDALNFLASDVKSCYMEFSRDESDYSNTNPILDYRYASSITKSELKKLNNDMLNEARLGCLKNFDRYDSMLISNNKNTKNNFLNKTNVFFTIKSTELFTNENASYNELLLRKNFEVQIIKELSCFLIDEYNRLK